MEAVMSEKRASAYVGCSAAAMRAWRRDGKGPSYFKAGKLVRYRRQDLDAWIDMHLVTPEAANKERCEVDNVE